MRIFRRKHTANFTVLPNALLRDSQLSFRARGVLVHLLSLEDGTPISAEQLRKLGREGRQSILTALSELEAAGYLVRSRHRNEAGQWASDVSVYDVPSPTTAPNRRTDLDSDLTESSFPTSENRVPESRITDYQMPASPQSAEPNSASQVSASTPLIKEPIKNTPPNPQATTGRGSGEAVLGAGFYIPEATAVTAIFNSLPISLMPRTPGDQARVVEILRPWLLAGHSPESLLAAITVPAPPVTILDVASFIRSRLERQGPNAQVIQLKPQRQLMPWCTECESESSRWISAPDGSLMPCPTCSPQSSREEGTL